MPDSVPGAEDDKRLTENENNTGQPDLIRYGLARAIQIDAEDLRARFPDLVLDLDLIEDENLMSEDANLAFFQAYKAAIDAVLNRGAGGQAAVRTYPLREDMVMEVRLSQAWEHDSPPGLAEVEERVKAAGGEVTVRPGEKTTVQVRIPMGS